MAQKEAENTLKKGRQLELPVARHTEVTAALAYVVLARAGFIDWDRERAEAYIADLANFGFREGVFTQPEVDQLKAGF